MNKNKNNTDMENLKPKTWEEASDDVRGMALMVNCYFYALEASDLLLRRFERHYRGKGGSLRHNLKQRHNELMRTLDKMKNLMLTLADDYELSFKNDNVVEGVDAITNMASYFARLMLTICDREESNPSLNVMQAAMKYVQGFYTRDVVPEEWLNQLKIK